MKNRIALIKWFVPLELNHSSYIYTSLIEFCRLQNIKFRVSSKNLNRQGRISIEQGIKKYSLHLNPKINWIQIKFNNGEIKNIAFDLNDDPKCFGKYSLEHVDMYYKRCYQVEIINELPDKYSKKVRPLGLPFMVRPDRLSYFQKLRLYFYIFTIMEIFKVDSLIITRLKFYKIKTIKHFNGFLKTRSVSDFDYFKSDVQENIFYQKRLFKETSDGVRQLNQQRARIIRILRDTFPSHFFGGLQSNTISRADYPELISNIKGDQHSFLETMRNCGICIYTNGLFGSPGWTLPEYLSQGKCIIAQNLENILPFPLINGKHLVYFSNDKELLELCEDLITDRNKRIILGENARKYYEEYVDPKVFFENLLISNFE